MKTKKIIQILMIAVGLASVAIMHFNCAPTPFRSALPASSGSLFTTSFGKIDSPYVVMSSDQIYQSMLNVTGLLPTGTATLPGNITTEFGLRTTSLPESEAITQINGPILIASTSLAGVMCDSLLTREIPLAPTARTYFVDVNFAASVLTASPATYNLVVRNLARGFWGRELNDDEALILTEHANAFITDLPAPLSTTEGVRQLRNLYLGVCTSMLASFEAITY